MTYSSIRMSSIESAGLHCAVKLVEHDAAPTVAVTLTVYPVVAPLMEKLTAALPLASVDPEKG